TAGLAVDLKLHGAVAAQGQVILADLVRLGKVGVKVIFPVKFGEVGDLAAQREPRLDRVFQRLFVEHGKRPGKAEAHRADLGVSLRPKVGAAAAPDLGAGGKLDVDFEADDHFVHVTPPPAGAWAG